MWRAWVALRRNNGAPGIDKTTLADVEEYGVTRLLGELAIQLREGTWCPLPARKVLIPKPGSAERRPLAIAAVRGRVVQAAMKILLEPVFEADFLSCSFGFRPKRSAHDALQVLIDESWQGRRSARALGQIRNHAFLRLAIWMSKRGNRRHAWGWGIKQVLLSPDHLSLIILDRTVIPPRPFRPWRENAECTR